jgi:hypothetical protein
MRRTKGTKFWGQLEGGLSRENVSGDWFLELERASHPHWTVMRRVRRTVKRISGIRGSMTRFSLMGSRESGHFELLKIVFGRRRWDDGDWQWDVVGGVLCVYGASIDEVNTISRAWECTHEEETLRWMNDRS